MISFRRRLRLTATEQTTIRELERDYLMDGMWGCSIADTRLRRERDELKRSIKRRLIQLNGDVCPYCLGSFSDHDPLSVEHYAPKSPTKHPEFTFEPLNLYIACLNCNLGYKKNKETLRQPKSRRYRDCVFIMFHPNLHSVHDHFLILGSRSGFMVPITDEAAEFFRILKIVDRLDDLLPNIRKLRGDRRLDQNLDRVGEILGISRIRRR